MDRDFFLGSKLNSKKNKLQLLILILLVVALPIALYLALRQTFFRPKAANPLSTLNLTPSGYTATNGVYNFPLNTDINVNFILKSGGSSVESAEGVIEYDPTVLQLDPTTPITYQPSPLNQDALKCTQTYFTNIDSTHSRIHIARTAVSLPGCDPATITPVPLPTITPVVSGNTHIMATIKFTTLKNVSGSSISLLFPEDDPATADVNEAKNYSNVSALGGAGVQDLGTVENISFSVGSASLTPSPTTAPTGNLALNKTTTVSSTATGSNKQNAVDGNTATSWTSAAPPIPSPTPTPQWMYVDLGASYSTNTYTVKWGSVYATAYNVQISSDSSSWTDIYTVTNGTGGTFTFSSPRTARYARIYATAGSSQTAGISVNEFEIYPPAGPTATTAPTATLTPTVPTSTPTRTPTPTPTRTPTPTITNTPTPTRTPTPTSTPITVSPPPPSVTLSPTATRAPTATLPQPSSTVPVVSPTCTYNKAMGDADGNCKIDTTDYNIWLNEYRASKSTTTPTPTTYQADFDGVGGVTTTDFNIWLNGYRAARITPAP